jgi:chlorite dismutase
MAERLLNIYSTFRYTDRYRNLSEDQKIEAKREIVAAFSTLAPANHYYTVYPTRSESDLMIWSALPADDTSEPARFFKAYAKAVEKLGYLAPEGTFWGFTQPSMYSRGKSEQDMDPMEGPRGTYLVVYPFSKTKDWYLMSMDARQGQMNEHIKLGKTYFDIKQLLLYSVGLQDHEFVVSYETEDLPRFSELVRALRSTEARRHTLIDTPIITAIYQTPEEFAS